MEKTFNSPIEWTTFNEQLGHVFNRFNINSKSGKSLENLSSNPQFITDLLLSFNKSVNQDLSRFEKYDIDVIVQYLEFSHKYYLEQRLPKIAQTVWSLLKGNKENNTIIIFLANFFYTYCEDLKKHFEYEEKYLFPYSKLLYAKNKFPKFIDEKDTFLASYSIKKFKEFHLHHEEKELQAVKDALLNYKPGLDNNLSYRILLEQLKSFEKDMQLHSLIEDYVLIPKLEKLEINEK